MREQNGISYFLRIALSVGISIVVGILILALSAIFVYSSEDPGTLILPVSLLCLSVTSTLCGALSVRLCDRKIDFRLTAIIAGLILAVIIILAGALPIEEGRFGATEKLIGGICTTALSFMGGLMLYPRDKKRRKYPVKRKKR